MFLDYNLNFHKMIDMHSKYDNMHKNGMFYALIFINILKITCINCMILEGILIRGVSSINDPHKLFFDGDSSFMWTPNHPKEVMNIMYLANQSYFNLLFIFLNMKTY